MIRHKKKDGVKAKEELEATLGLELNHPNVVRTYKVSLSDPFNRFANAPPLGHAACGERPVTDASA